MNGNQVASSGRISQVKSHLQPVKNLEAHAKELIEAKRYEDALRILVSLAENKDQRALFRLGYLYSNGLGVPVDYPIGMKYYQAATDQGCTVSLCNTGVMHFMGQGTPADHQEAMRCFKAAKDQGQTSGAYGAGLLYYLGLVDGVPNYQEALTYFRAAADNNLAQGWYKLSMSFRYGLGVPPNEDEAQACFQKAVECGLSKSSVEEYQQEGLTWALTYLEKQEYSAAFVNLLSLAQDGNEEAKRHLVQLCLSGCITDGSNLPIAISILKNAHQNGESKAAFMAGKMITQLPRPFLFGRQEIIDDALIWFQKAAKGENGADNYQGEAYYQMSRLTQEEDLDFPSISVYLEKAHYQGHPTALNDIYDMSRRYLQAAQDIFVGDIVNDVRSFILTENYLRIRQEESTEKSLGLKMKLQFQEQKFLEEQFALEMKKLEKIAASSLSLQEQEVQFDVAQTFINKNRPDFALVLLESLAENSHAKAQCLLGQLHLDGIGLEEINIDKAITYFKKAFDSGYEEAGFLLIDCYLTQSSPDNQSKLPLAKEIVTKMVEEYLFDDRGLDQTKKEALLCPTPNIPGAVNDWYEINSFYLKAALKMAKIHYLENPSSGKDMLALAQEIVTTANKNTQLELIEWYLTRPASGKDKASEKHWLETMIESIDVIKIPDIYPKTRALFSEMAR